MFDRALQKGDLQQRSQANEVIAFTLVGQLAPVVVNAAMLVLYLVVMLRFSVPPCGAGPTGTSPLMERLIVWAAFEVPLLIAFCGLSSSLFRALIITSMPLVSKLSIAPEALTARPPRP